MGYKLVEVIQRHFNLSIDMLEKVIDYCPDEIWLKRKSKYLLWHIVIKIKRSKNHDTRDD